MTNPILDDHKVIRGQRIPVEQIRTDATTNREVDESYVLDLAAKWDPSLYEELTVFADFPFDEADTTEGDAEYCKLKLRDDMTFTVGEGQHRRDAAERKGESHLWCKVHFIQDPSERHLVHFLVQGSRKADSAWEIWRARLNSQKFPNVTALNKGLEEMNLSVSQKSTSKNKIGSPGTLNRLADKYDADVILFALTILDLAFDRDADGTVWNTYLVDGMVQVVEKYGKVLGDEPEAIAEKFRGTKNRPMLPEFYIRDMLRVLSGLQSTGGSAGRAAIMRELLVSQWNKRTRSSTSKLPSARDIESFLVD